MQLPFKSDGVDGKMATACTMQEEDFILALFEHHVFVCQNARPEGAPRPSCTKDGKSDLLPQLQMFAKAAGLGGKVRIQQVRLPRPM